VTAELEPAAERRSSSTSSVRRGGVPVAADVEREVIRRLGRIGQRLTAGRRALLAVLRSADRPLSVASLLAADVRLHQSSVYRNLHALEAAGVVARLAGPAGEGHYELAETLAGHHHHLVCRHCGRLEDCVLPEVLERSLDEVARSTGRRHRFVVDEHRLDLLGLCADCA
jgi:Fur family ferric uptake transcriptional regulator